MTEPLRNSEEGKQAVNDILEKLMREDITCILGARLAKYRRWCYILCGCIFAQWLVSIYIIELYSEAQRELNSPTIKHCQAALAQCNDEKILRKVDPNGG